MRVDPRSFDAASTSQVRLEDAYFGGLVEKQRRNPSHQEEEDSEDSDNPEAEIWYYRGKEVAEEPVNSKAWEQPLAHGAEDLHPQVNAWCSYFGSTRESYELCAYCGTRFFHRTFLFGAKLAIMSGPWTSPLLDAAPCLAVHLACWRSLGVQARVRGRDVAG